MALTPSIRSTVNTGTVARTVTTRANSLSLVSSASKAMGNQKQHKTSLNAAKSVTKLSENIQTIKDCSLLYQLVNHLLLAPREEHANISNAFQVELHLEVSVIDINQQSITIVDQSNRFTETTIVIEALNISIEASTSGQFQLMQVSDPLIIDVNGDGIATPGINARALFDINADGIIDHGFELFGEQHGFENGLSDFSSVDYNNDRVIDTNDNIFNSLLMMRLVDNKQFITALTNTNITSIGLDYSNSESKDSAGVRIVQLSEYKNSEGQQGRVADLLLQYKRGLNTQPKAISNLNKNIDSKCCI